MTSWLGKFLWPRKVLEFSTKNFPKFNSSSLRKSPKYIENNLEAKREWKEEVVNARTTLSDIGDNSSRSILPYPHNRLGKGCANSIKGGQRWRREDTSYTRDTVLATGRGMEEVARCVRWVHRHVQADSSSLSRRKTWRGGVGGCRPRGSRDDNEARSSPRFLSLRISCKTHGGTGSISIAE